MDGPAAVLLAFWVWKTKDYEVNQIGAPHAKLKRIGPPFAISYFFFVQRGRPFSY